MNDEDRERIVRNWQSVQREVAEAAEAAGRALSEIRIIGVSKYVDAEMTLALFNAGCVDLGESRPQSLWQKAESPGLDGGPKWHMIGHLQSNKVRRTLRYQPVVHSVDSEKILNCIADESQRQGLQTSVLLEINISGDESKTGLVPDAAERLLSDLPAEGVRLIGLMAMAGWGTDGGEASRQFELARELRDKWRGDYQLELPELSMGMSGDFREAIAAGATMVRIGSSLFDGLMEKR